LRIAEGESLLRTGNSLLSARLEFVTGVAVCWLRQCCSLSDPFFSRRKEKERKDEEGRRLEEGIWEEKRKRRYGVESGRGKSRMSAEESFWL
jgi:hypothetical protein